VSDVHRIAGLERLPRDARCVGAERRVVADQIVGRVGPDDRIEDVTILVVQPNRRDRVAEHLFDVLDRCLRGELPVGRLQQILCRLVERLQRPRPAVELGLLCALLPDIDDRCDQVRLAVVFERAEAERHGHFGPVRASCAQVQARRHRAGFGVDDVAVELLAGRISVGIVQQRLEMGPLHLHGRVSEDLLDPARCRPGRRRRCQRSRPRLECRRGPPGIVPSLLLGRLVDVPALGTPDFLASKVRGGGAHLAHHLADPIFRFELVGDREIDPSTTSKRNFATSVTSYIISSKSSAVKKPDIAP